MIDATGNSSNTTIAIGAGLSILIWACWAISPGPNTSCETEDPKRNSPRITTGAMMAKRPTDRRVW